MYGRGFAFADGPMSGGWLLGGALHGLFGLALLVGLVLFVVWVAKHAQSSSTHHDDTPAAFPAAPVDDAVAIARTRLATGEITPAQYREIVSALGGPTGS